MLLKPLLSYRSLSVLKPYRPTLSTMASSLSSATITPGLERILPLLQRLGSPQDRFPVIHIAGTNSKGTTSCLLDSLLTATGIRCARFNSPHLRYQRDSMRIDGGRIVPIDTWNRAGDQVDEATKAAEPSAQATSFEQLVARFLVACTLSDPLPDLLIVECGMGGRLDATNVFPAHQVLASIITPIGRDHKSFLGDTLEEVTRHKMGIAKQGGLVVVADQAVINAAGSSSSSASAASSRLWGPQQDNADTLGSDAAAILGTIRQEAAELNARVVRCEESRLETFVASTSTSHSDKPWQTTSQWKAKLPPILQPPEAASREVDAATGVSLREDQDESTHDSKDAAVFTATAGQPALTTPLLPPLQPLPSVRSALSTALSTLFAIASDEPASSRGLPGTAADEHEMLRLQLAFALREGGLMAGERGELRDDLHNAIIRGVESWEGRGSWIDVPIKGLQSSSEMAEVSATDAASPSLHLLVDGAHNLPAFGALFDHLKTILSAHRGDDSPLTLSILVAFSESKEKDGDLSSILEVFARLPERLSQARQQAGSTAKVKVRIAIVTFETPVEGMPWVQPLSPLRANEVFDAVLRRRQQAGHGTESSSIEGITVQTVNNTLQEGLTWLSEAGAGRPHDASLSIGSSTTSSLHLVTGSLYLVGQLYRSLDEAKAADRVTVDSKGEDHVDS